MIPNSCKLYCIFQVIMSEHFSAARVSSCISYICLFTPLKTQSEDTNTLKKSKDAKNKELTT